MAKLNDLLSRIQTDYGFYLQICVLLTFQKSPHAALAPYKLSSEERIALTESGAQLWAHLRHPIPTTQTSQGCAPDSVRAIRSSDRKSTRLNSSHQIISYAVF